MSTAPTAPPAPASPSSRSALALAAFMAIAGVNHFLNPGFYDRLIPTWMPGSDRFWTLASGVAEVGTGVATAVPRTRRLGALASFAVIVGVYPANVQMALDGGIEGESGPLGSAAAAWLRLPLQIPMLVWAARVARRARR